MGEGEPAESEEVDDGPGSPIVMPDDTVPDSTCILYSEEDYKGETQSAQAGSGIVSLSLTTVKSVACAEGI